MTGADRQIAFHTALDNVARELETLADKAFVIDEALGKAIGSEDPSAALPMTLTQDVDLLRQSADCLRITMANLVKITGATPQPPDQIGAHAMTEGVYLAALRARMSGGPDIELESLKEMTDWIDV